MRHLNGNPLIVFFFYTYKYRNRIKNQMFNVTSDWRKMKEGRDERFL